MPRFRFELEVVLEHRLRIEQDRQKAVAELETVRVGLENRIRECQHGLENERREMKLLLQASDMRGVRHQAAASNRLIGSAQRAALELAGVHKRLEVARAALLEATKRRKAVELLKERRYEEWMQKQNKKEAEAIDEMAVMAASRGDES